MCFQVYLSSRKKWDALVKARELFTFFTLKIKPLKGGIMNGTKYVSEDDTIDAFKKLDVDEFINSDEVINTNEVYSRVFIASTDGEWLDTPEEVYNNDLFGTFIKLMKDKRFSV